MKYEKFIIIFNNYLIDFFSCEKKDNIISSYSLNKAQGIYKFKEKPFTGKVLDTTQTGRVILTFDCIKGRLNGQYIEYYSDLGTLKNKVTFVNGIKTGPYLSLTKNGDTLFSGNYLNNRKNGVWKEYYNNGKLKSHGLYTNGLQNGVWKYYYKIGLLEAIGAYKDGNISDLGNTEIPKTGRVGLWKFYYNTGILQQESEYNDGKLSGKVIQYHENGNVSFKGNYKNQKEHGKIQIYDKNGNLEYEEIFKDGVKI